MEPAKIEECFSRIVKNNQQCCYTNLKTSGTNGGRMCLYFDIGKSNAEYVEIVRGYYEGWDPHDIKVVCKGDPYEEDYSSYLKIGLLFIIGLLF